MNRFSCALLLTVVAFFPVSAIVIPRVTVPAGSFLMGQDGTDPSSYEDEVPIISTHVPEFEISVYEISNDQFVQFLNTIGRDHDNLGNRYYDFEDPDARIVRTGDNYTVLPGWGNHPVTEVSWYGANDFCEWVGGRLPTEEEWEKAARWDPITSHARMWPWGNSFDCWRNSSWWCNDPDRTYPVDHFPGGVSYYGAHQMAGNVWEWTLGGYSSYPGNPDLTFADPTREVQRGGSWTNSDYNLRCATRSPQPRYMTDANLGFRVAWSQHVPTVLPTPSPNVADRQVWIEDFNSSANVSIVQIKHWWISGSTEWVVQPHNSWFLARIYKNDPWPYPAGEVMAMYRVDLSDKFKPGDVVDISTRIFYERGDRGFARTSVAFSWGNSRMIDPGGRGADENTGYPWYLLANNTDAPNVWHEVTVRNVVWEQGRFCVGFGLWCNLTDQASPPISPELTMKVDWIKVEHSVQGDSSSLTVY